MCVAQPAGKQVARNGGPLIRPRPRKYVDSARIDYPKSVLIATVLLKQKERSRKHRLEQGEAGVVARARSGREGHGRLSVWEHELLFHQSGAETRHCAKRATISWPTGGSHWGMTGLHSGNFPGQHDDKGGAGAGSNFCTR